MIHVAAIGLDERPNAFASARPAFTLSACFVRRAWLQLTIAWLLIAANACTPVGAVNKRNAEQREAASAADNAADASDAPPRSVAGGSAGRDGKLDPAVSGGRAAASSSAGRNSGVKAAGAGGMGGAAGKRSSGGASAAAGSGTDAGAGSGAAGMAADGDWYCLQQGPACVCVQSDELSGDACTLPKPSCCFTLVRLGSNACTCWPEDSEECRTQPSEVPDAKRVDHCPP